MRLNNHPGLRSFTCFLSVPASALAGGFSEASKFFSLVRYFKVPASVSGTSSTSTPASCHPTISIHSCSQFTGLYGLATANVPRMATTAMSHSNSMVLICLANLLPCHELIKSSGLLHSTPTNFSPAQNSKSILSGVLKCTTPSPSPRLGSSLVSAIRLVYFPSSLPSESRITPSFTSTASPQHHLTSPL